MDIRNEITRKVVGKLKNRVPNEVEEILGHADLKKTQIYCYIDKKNGENAYRKYAN
jgi:hypothetical protein